MVLWGYEPWPWTPDQWPGRQAASQELCLWPLATVCLQRSLVSCSTCYQTKHFQTCFLWDCLFMRLSPVLDCWTLRRRRNDFLLLHMYGSAAQSCLTLCDAVDCSLPGSSVHGILLARILEWVVMPSSRESSCSKDCTSGIGRRILYHAPPGKCPSSWGQHLFLHLF